MDYTESIDIKQQKKLIQEFTEKFEEKLNHRTNVENSYKLEARLDEIIRELDIHGKFFSLFHELNYQRVVNNLDKQLMLWKFGIGLLIIVGCIGLYSAAWFEPFVPTSINDDYKALIDVVEESTYFKDPDLRQKLDGSILTDLTSTYFNIYFARYLILRIFIAAIYLTVVTFTLRIYNRIRRNRMIMIHKEEATTTTLYLLETIGDNPDKTKLLNLIIPELYKLDYSVENKRNKKLTNTNEISIDEKDVTNLFEDKISDMFDAIISLVNSRVDMVLPKAGKKANTL